MDESHPEVAEYWLEATTRILTKQLPCSDEHKLECAIALLANEALSCEQYLEERKKKFLYLKQGSKHIGQYVALGIEDFQELVNRALATEAKMKASERKKKIVRGPRRGLEVTMDHRGNPRSKGIRRKAI
ncbi:hypothetical protein V6N13_059493 [Hibiscus sabdariffa]